MEQAPGALEAFTEFAVASGILAWLGLYVGI